jgi:hypothetical protein
MPKAKRSRKRAQRAERLRDLIFEMEPPINEALAYASALRLIGWGLVTLDDEAGCGVLATVDELKKRLDQIKLIWGRMLPERKRGRS